jgi:hypothetical protein
VFLEHIGELLEGQRVALVYVRVTEELLERIVVLEVN